MDETMEKVKTAAEQAEQVEQEAMAEGNKTRYVHEFRKPFSYQGNTFERMTFDFDTLNGKDSAAVERALMRRGITVVIGEYTVDYLSGMAARACTERDGDGHRIVSVETLEAMPVGDFRTICGKTRSFLLRAGS